MARLIIFLLFQNKKLLLIFRKRSYVILVYILVHVGRLGLSICILMINKKLPQVVISIQIALCLLLQQMLNISGPFLYIK